MIEDNPVTGPPRGGRNDRSEDSSPPGTYGTSETVQPPDPSGGGDTASRAATEGPMTSDPPSAMAGEMTGSDGVAEQLGPPSSTDGTDGTLPGGSLDHRSGHDPDH